MKRREILQATAAACSGLLLSSRPIAGGSGLPAQDSGPRRIPITMSHGVGHTNGGVRNEKAEHFDRQCQVAHALGCESIDYDDLQAWRNGTKKLPRRPLMLDFDHPGITMRFEVLEVLKRYGFRGTLFINTAGIEKMVQGPLPDPATRQFMTWEEVGELVAAGWKIGAHTVNHPNLSELSRKDPSGARLREELDQSNETIQRRLGIKPLDFAFTGTSWSSAAEREVMKRYRFGRLWIIGNQYKADGQAIRYSDLVGVPGPDEADGGPPKDARYITRETNPYRLPSMDLDHLIHAPEAFRRYLEEA